MLTFYLATKLLLASHPCASAFVDEIDDGMARVIWADRSVATVDASALPSGAREGQTVCIAFP